MSPRNQFRYPLVDLSILLAMVCIGWAVFRLTNLEPQLASDQQQSEELPAVFQECKELFRGSIENPELPRRVFDLDWYQALLFKSEYLGIAERLEMDLPQLSMAVSDASAQKGRGERQQRIQDLKGWIDKQKVRADLERLEVRSKELKDRIAGTPLRATNGPVSITTDLGTLLKEIDRAYEGYLTDVRDVTNNAGKPLVDAFVTQRLDRARKAAARLAELARQARQDARAIDLFLETLAQSDAAKRTRRQEEVIRAFLEAGSPAEFARRIRIESGVEGRGASDLEIPSLRWVRYGLWLVLVGLGIFLIVDVHWRTVVMPLRLKLVQSHTIMEQQEKLANFEQLAAALAHEIRNPLTTINARLYTVQRKLQEGTPEQKDAMVIGHEIDRVSQILKDFIQLTRPSAPELGLMTAEPLLKDVRDLMAPLLQQQAIRLDCQSPGKARFYGDRQQLKQVLINLIQNAAESIERDGAIILRARDAILPFKGSESKVAVIEVEDNGPGVPPEVQGRLFEPFFSTRKEGTGLGLPISARIIDRHGGTLDFETHAGAGTVFRIVLPAQEER